ncbi:MAG: ribonuclease H-like YkuK family protein [Microgenomates group bacterium]
MFYSPTFGKVNLEKLKKIIASFMAADKKAVYEVIVGTDSQKIATNKYDFVSALIIHRVGFGGIYFWKREIIEKKISLKERIYQEAIMSLQNSETFVDFFKSNGISKYKIQIHVDIGKNGETRDLINEVTGMIRSSGYDAKIKPESYGASKVADRYT